jgi:hypothetical protein
MLVDRVPVERQQAGKAKCEGKAEDGNVNGSIITAGFFSHFVSL